MPFLGRREEPDARDLGFLMRAARPITMAVPLEQLSQRVSYRRGPILDQGSTSTCVGHAVVALLTSSPVRVGPTRAPSPYDLYDEACLLDPWEENDHDTDRSFGTSVRAGIKAAKARGFISSYHWAVDTEDVLRWMLMGLGPVVFGIDWYSEMFTPDAEGIIRPRGSAAGGHAITAVGADLPRGLVTLQQSWGVTHGGWYVKTVGPAKRQYLGCVRLPIDDLRTLLSGGGEAVAIVEAPYRAGEE